MYIMSRIGIANSVGLAIEVLILLLLLADSFAGINTSFSPLQFHPSLLAALDDGVTEDGPFRLVSSYACAWWKDDRPDTDQIFCMTTIDECLDRHRQYVTHERMQTDSPPITATHPLASNETRCSSCYRLQHLLKDMMGEVLVFEGPVGLRSQPLLAATATATGHLTHTISPTATATAADRLVTSCCSVATGSNQSQLLLCTIICK